jgi:hypothetical protein
MRWRTDRGAPVFHTFLILIRTMRELATATAKTKSHFDSPTAIAWGRCYARCMEAALTQACPGYVEVKASNLVRRITHHNNAPAAHQGAGAQITWTAVGQLAATYKILCEEGMGRQHSLQVTNACFNRTYRAFIRHVCQPLYHCGPAYTAHLQRLNFESFSTELVSASQRRAYAFDAIFAHYALDAQSAAALGAVVREADCAWKKTLDAQLRTHAPLPGPMFKPFYFAPRAATRASAINAPVLVLTPEHAAAAFG